MQGMANTNEMPPKLRPLLFHGLQIRRVTEEQAQGDCPFCGKPRHFYVNPANGKWDCKRCGRKGNIYSFLRQWYEFCLSETPETAYKELSEERSIPVEAFAHWQLARDPQGRWLFPVHNLDGRLVNLHLREQSGSPILSTPGCKLHLIGEQNIPSSMPDSPVYICEGFWDTYALSWAVRRGSQPALVLGVPGAQVFKPEWSEWLARRDVKLLYDNDPAGARGMSSMCLKLTHSRLWVIRWPAGLSEGYDISDYVKSRRRAPVKLLKELERMLVPFTSQEGKKAVHTRPSKPPSLKKVLNTYRKYLHLDPVMEDAIKVMFACVLSIKVPGDPLWLFLVGPPGAGKTVVLRCLEAVPYCHFESTLTPHSLISGWRTPDGSDPSLIKLLADDKVLVIKDYTAIKSMPVGEQEEIYGLLRDAYDGRIDKVFGHLGPRQYTCHFGIVAGVTDVIYGDERATLGERFLKCAFIGPEHASEKHIRAAMRTIQSQADWEDRLRQITADFLDRDLSRVPKIPGWWEDRIIALSQVVAYLRAGVIRRGGELISRPRPEIGTRLAKQLVKLSQLLTVILETRGRITKEVCRLVTKVGLDTVAGWNQEIIRALAAVYPDRLTVQEISQRVSASDSSVRRRLEDMRELRIVTRRSESNGGRRGKPSYGYALVPELYKLWERAKLEKG